MAIQWYVKGQMNESVERQTFRRRVQQPGESFDDFLVSLHELAKTCQFCSNEKHPGSNNRRPSRSRYGRRPPQGEKPHPRGNREKMQITGSSQEAASGDDQYSEWAYSRRSHPQAAQPHPNSARQGMPRLWIQPSPGWSPTMPRIQNHQQSSFSNRFTRTQRCFSHKT